MNPNKVLFLLSIILIVNITLVNSQVQIIGNNQPGVINLEPVITNGGGNASINQTLITQILNDTNPFTNNSQVIFPKTNFPQDINLTGNINFNTIGTGLSFYFGNVLRGRFALGIGQVMRLVVNNTLGLSNDADGGMIAVNDLQYNTSFFISTPSEQYTFFTNPTNNRVGIGTSIPTTKLEVNGTLNTTNLSVININNFFNGACPSGNFTTNILTNGSLICGSDISGSSSIQNLTNVFFSNQSQTAAGNNTWTGTNTFRNTNITSGYNLTIPSATSRICLTATCSSYITHDGSNVIIHSA